MLVVLVGGELGEAAGLVGWQENLKSLHESSQLPEAFLALKPQLLVRFRQLTSGL